VPNSLCGGVPKKLSRQGTYRNNLSEPFALGVCSGRVPKSFRGRLPEKIVYMAFFLTVSSFVSGWLAFASCGALEAV
jgi:hypothetical protein